MIENGSLLKKSKRRHVQEISFEGGIIFSDLILSPTSLSNTGVSLETFCKIIKGIITLWLWKRGLTNFFRGNATSVSLNVLIFKLWDSELTELWKLISLK